MNHPDRVRTAQHGFTLVEIMVVVVILGLLATLVVPNVLGQSEEARLQTAQTNASQIHQAVTTFMTRNVKIPEWEDLFDPDVPGGPLLLSEDARMDPWGNEFQIQAIEGKRLRAEVVSWGPDGVEGTEDDIVYPRRSSGRD